MRIILITGFQLGVSAVRLTIFLPQLDGSAVRLNTITWEIFLKSENFSSENLAVSIKVYKFASLLPMTVVCPAGLGQCSIRIKGIFLCPDIYVVLYDCHSES